MGITLSFGPRFLVALVVVLVDVEMLIALMVLLVKFPKGLPELGVLPIIAVLLYKVKLLSAVEEAIRLAHLFLLLLLAVYLVLPCLSLLVLE